MCKTVTTVEVGIREAGRAGARIMVRAGGLLVFGTAEEHLRLGALRTHEIRVRHWSFFWITGQRGSLTSLAALTFSCQSSSNHFLIPGPQAPSEAKEAGMKSKPAVRASAPCFLVLWADVARIPAPAPAKDWTNEGAHTRLDPPHTKGRYTSLRPVAPL